MKWHKPNEQMPELNTRVIVVQKCGGLIKCAALFTRWGFVAMPDYDGHFKQSTINYWRYANDTKTD